MLPLFERPQMGAAVAAIHAAQRILLTCHINPDGDALGSMIGLGMGLDRLGKEVFMVSADAVPEVLGFLPDTDRLLRVAPDGVPCELAIVLDAGDLARVGKTRSAIEAAPRVLDIDHHVTSGAFGDIQLLDATAAATAEIVYDLLRALDVEITLPIAECLLCGLLTDTGSFRFMNVTPRTMWIAGEMVALGASPNKIAECVFENRPFAAQKLLGRALDSLKRSADGRVVWAHVGKEDFADFAATDEATEGIVNALRAIRGADVAIFLRQMESGKVRVSLRARPPVDVAEIASAWGGGGHSLASGCTLDGPLAQAEAQLVADVIRRVAALPDTQEGSCDSEDTDIPDPGAPVRE